MPPNLCARLLKPLDVFWLSCEKKPAFWAGILWDDGPCIVAVGVGMEDVDEERLASWVVLLEGIDVEDEEADAATETVLDPPGTGFRAGNVEVGYSMDVRLFDRDRATWTSTGIFSGGAWLVGCATG